MHTHSTWATAWAQAEREIPVLGTTHADLCSEPIPVTRALTPDEVRDAYEAATGTALLEAIAGTTASCRARSSAATLRSAGGATPPRRSRTR